MAYTHTKKKKKGGHDISQDAEEGVFPAFKSLSAAAPTLHTASYPHDAGDSKASSGESSSDFLNPRHHCSVKCYHTDLLRGKNLKKS